MDDKTVWKKNDRFTVTIEDLSEDGSGIGKTDGYIWFIKDTVIGDVVEAKAMKTKKSYGFARLERVIAPSPKRITPACPVARQCGGCQLQAMRYEEGLKFKEKKVFENLRRIGGFENLRRAEEPNAETDDTDRLFASEGCADACGGESVAASDAVMSLKKDSFMCSKDVNTSDDADSDAAMRAKEGIAMPDDDDADIAAEENAVEKTIPFYPIIGMDNPWRYRNKAQIPFGLDKNGEIVTGFYAGRTHAIIGHDDCLLGVEENRQILSVIKQYMRENHIAPYDEETRRGLVRHALIRKGFRTGEMMVCLVINGRKLPAADRLTAALREMSGMTSISYCINTDDTNVILGREIVNLFGPGYITDYIGNVKYRISPQSFYQVNPVQTEKLYGTALEYAGLTGTETVWDLYCGIGTISLFLAQKAGRVYGVEAVPQAVADARENARLNGLTNVEFFEGRAEEVLPRMYAENRIAADVVVVDPPRKGCDTACLDTIVKMAPRRVVYVSCDSATLGRDLRYLCENGYELRKVQCVEMFAWSTHVETVCLLSNTQSKKKESYITLDVEMADYYRIKNEGKNSTT